MTDDGWKPLITQLSIAPAGNGGHAARAWYGPLLLVSPVEVVPYLIAFACGLILTVPFRVSVHLPHTAAAHKIIRLLTNHRLR